MWCVLLQNLCCCAKFRSANFDLEDAPRPGRPLEADVDKITSLVDVNRRIRTVEIAEGLSFSSATVHVAQ